MVEGDNTPNEKAEFGRKTFTRITVAAIIAAAFGIGIYYLLTSIRAGTGLISFSFLFVVPAAVSAFVSYVIDPWAKRSLKQYQMVPVWLGAGSIVISLFILHEGVICVILLSPIWLVSGLVGAAATFSIRKRLKKGQSYSFAILLLPFVVMQLEPLIALPATTATVSRSIIVEASPEQIWPLLRGVPDVHQGEGQWNISQDIIGIPRPRGAQLIGEGIGADRHAVWDKHIRFRERITEWQPQKQISWRFIFDEAKGWEFTDRHLMPDSPYFKVTTGGYRLESVGTDRTRVVIHTSYWMKTPLNDYCALWGEFFLGDLENNLLALIKRRAENPIESGRWPYVETHAN